jgi:hypothetical protein
MYTFKISNLQSDDPQVTEIFLQKQLQMMQDDDEILSGDTWFGDEHYDVNVFGGEYYGAGEGQWKGNVYTVTNECTDKEVAWFDIEIYKDGEKVLPD